MTRLNGKLIKYNRQYTAAMAKQTKKLQVVQQTVRDSWIELVNIRMRIGDDLGNRTLQRE